MKKAFEILTFQAGSIGNGPRAVRLDIFEKQKHEKNKNMKTADKQPSIDSYGFLRISIDFYGFLWISYGFLWISYGLAGYLGLPLLREPP